jgi:hypothetical protein
MIKIPRVLFERFTEALCYAASLDKVEIRKSTITRRPAIPNGVAIWAAISKSLTMLCLSSHSAVAASMMKHSTHLCFSCPNPHEPHSLGRTAGSQIKGTSAQCR